MKASRWFFRMLRGNKMWSPDSGISEEHQFNGKAITVKKMPFTESRVLLPKDQLVLTMTDSNGITAQARTFEITKNIRADEGFMFEMEDELGYTHALVGGFGQVGD